MDTTSQIARRSRLQVAAPFAAGLMVVALSACGSGGPEALTITPGAGLSRNSALAGAEGASSDKAMDSMMIWNVEYTVKGTLPDLGDSARAWSLKTVKSSSVLSKARKVAAELGVTDKFVASGDKVSYTAGKTDGTTPNMWVYTGATESSWSYFAGNDAMTSSSGGVVSSCVASKDGTAVCDDPAPIEMKPPRNLPSKAEALARATEVIEATGEDIDAFTLTAMKDEWATSVQATMKIDGTDSPYSWWFGFGADKALTSASGSFVSFARGAEYPLVPTADAVERLNSGQFGYGMPKISRSADIAAATDDTVPMPEPTIITITGARLSLMAAYLADGKVVILPAYTFTNADGDVGSVYAIEDKYLKFDDGSSAPEPGDSKPGDGGDVVVPDDSGSGSGSNSGSGSTRPSKGSASGGSSTGSGGMVDGNSGSDPVSPGDPVTDAPIPDDEARRLVGLSEQDAMDLAKQEGWTVRIAERDGEQFMLTADYVTNRVNLTIERGKVTKVVVG